MPITVDNLRDFLRPGTDELARQRDQREEQVAAIMCGGDDSDGDSPTLVVWSASNDVCDWTITAHGAGGYSLTAVSGAGTGASDNHGWESYVPMPYDAPAPVDNAAVAAKAEATEQKGKSLMQAIGALQEQCKSDGKPPRFTVVEN